LYSAPSRPTPLLGAPQVCSQIILPLLFFFFHVCPLGVTSSSTWRPPWAGGPPPFNKEFGLPQFRSPPSAPRACWQFWKLCGHPPWPGPAEVVTFTPFGRPENSGNSPPYLTNFCIRTPLGARFFFGFSTPSKPGVGFCGSLSQSPDLSFT